MTLDTKMTLFLLQELLMASRANDADGCNSWLALGIDELAREIAAEVESEVQLLTDMVQAPMEQWVEERVKE